MATWNGIEQSEIAQTVREIAQYLQLKNVGSEHNGLAQQWLEQGGLADQIDQMDQVELDCLFGQSDPQNYWPGKFRPTLKDLNKGLEFFAYREDLEGQEPEAQSLIAKVNAFDGFGGLCHLAATGYSHEIGRYIAAAPRHPLESYAAPNEPAVDITNSVNYAFDWLENNYLPVDAKTVEARLEIGGNGSSRFSKYDELAHYKSSIEEGYRRAGMDVDVSVVLGQTYGDDAVVVRASMDEYSKYVAIKRGERNIDLSPTETLRPGGDIPGPRTSRAFRGFELDKAAFYGPGGTYVSADAIEQAGSNVTDKVDWLRQSGFITEEKVSVASSSGEKRYVRFSPQNVPRNQEPFTVGQRYWSSCDLYNEINRKLGELSYVLNGVTSESPHRTQNSKLASAWFEHAGKIYAPSNKAFEQAAFHFNTVSELPYGRIYTVYSKNLEKLDGSGDTPLFHKSHDGNSHLDSIRGRIGENGCYVFHTDALPEEQCAQVKQALVHALDDIKVNIEAGNTGMGVATVTPTGP